MGADCKSVGLRLRRFESCTCHCVMSRDIVDRCPETSLAFKACFRVSFRISRRGVGVEDQFADQCAGGVVQDADVEVIDEHNDFGAAASLA